MAEVLIFIAGALFCLFLLAALLAVLPGPSVASAGGIASSAARAPQMPRPAASAQQRAASTQRGRSPLLPPRLSPPRATKATAGTAERDAYRNAADLDRAEAALRAIAGSPEPAAAKIAAQALRRLSVSDAPARARLEFALSRLELLALRPERQARQVAARALGMAH